jgi:hypothetical protein
MKNDRKGGLNNQSYARPFSFLAAIAVLAPILQMRALEAKV